MLEEKAGAEEQEAGTRGAEEQEAGTRTGSENRVLEDDELTRIVGGNGNNDNNNNNDIFWGTSQGPDWSDDG